MARTDVTPQEARSLLGTGQYAYLDVRTPEEFEAGRPPGATNIPLMLNDPATGRMQPNPDFARDAQAKFPRDAKVIVGCRSGGRSARASEILRQEGYTNVLNMVGGFGGATTPEGQTTQPGWTTLGYPVEKGKSQK